MDYHSMGAKQLLEEFSASPKGLTSREVEKRQAQYGKNEIPSKPPKSALEIFIEQFKSILMLILIAAAIVLIIIAQLTGDSSNIVDAALILLIVVANAIFGFVQEYKAEQSIDALKKMSTHKAVVLRDGEEHEVDSRELVPGDIIIAKHGEIVPADARILKFSDLYVNESVLTGESVDVKKNDELIKGKAQLAETKNMLYMSTLVTKGTAEAIVVATGGKTQVGSIAMQIGEAEEKLSPFQEQVEQLGKTLGKAILGVIVIVGCAQLFMHEADFITVFITAVALAVAAIPEGLPAVVTLSLAFGTQKMLKKNSLVRKLSVVESLGSVDVICTDKTGTLTENRMTVTKIFFNGKYVDPDRPGGEDLDPILRTAVLCNNAHVGMQNFGQSLEIALLLLGKKYGMLKERLLERTPRVLEMPFSADKKRMTVANKEGSVIGVYMKGAPEMVLQHCSTILLNGRKAELTKQMKEKIVKQHENMAANALYTLGFASRQCTKLEKDPERNMTFLGLIGMIDPARPEVKGALKTCERAGIRVVMITGDNILTAKAIAKEIGLKGEAMEGKEIDERSDEEFQKIVEKTSIYARASPSHKVRILKALKANNHVVAMTGDGVNDAPALKNSDVGVSMGVRGTDVAKEASDMVLLDDNFATIVDAVKEGRTIFDNIRKFLGYLLASNLAEVLVVFIASLLGHLPITAVQLLWLNFITDGVPALALGMDPSMDAIMDRKPRPKSEGVLSKNLTRFIGVIGVEKSILFLSIFFLTLPQGIETARTMLFTAFIIFEFVVIFVIRAIEDLSPLSNKLLAGAVTVSLILQLAIMYSPIGKLFDIVPIGAGNWLVLIAGTAIGYVVALMLTRGRNF